MGNDFKSVRNWRVYRKLGIVKKSHCYNVTGKGCTITSNIVGTISLQHLFCVEILWNIDTTHNPCNYAIWLEQCKNQIFEPNIWMGYVVTGKYLAETPQNSSQAPSLCPSSTKWRQNSFFFSSWHFKYVWKQFIHFYYE